MQITKRTIINTVINALALVNSIMVMAGKPILNISTEEINTLVSVAFTVIAWISGFWYNNSFTPEAIKADDYLEMLRTNEYFEDVEYFEEDDDEGIE